MKTYNTKTAVYDVFSANMTLDTDGEVYRGNELSACKSCQCNCRLCLGGKAPERTEVFCEADAEGVLEKLLAA
ncbi:MAG: hypothetical protein ACOCUU_01820 [Nanoarchaeota archaeon]